MFFDLQCVTLFQAPVGRSCSIQLWAVTIWTSQRRASKVVIHSSFLEKLSNHHPANPSRCPASWSPSKLRLFHQSRKFPCKCQDLCRRLLSRSVKDQQLKHRFKYFFHNFCVKPYVPREPRRNPSNRRLNEHHWDIHPTLPGIELTTCSVPSGSRYHSATVMENICYVLSPLDNINRSNRKLYLSAGRLFGNCSYFLNHFSFFVSCFVNEVVVNLYTIFMAWTLFYG